jgi:hypothetical protein
MRKILFFIIVGVGVILTATSVPAATFTYPLDIEFSGATEPEGLTPWLTATFEDVATNQVQLTMSASGLTDAEFVSEWYFNFDPAFNPGDRITFPLIISGPPYLPGTGIGANNFQADGESEKFDIVFQFEIANNPNRFTMGESAVYLFTGTGGPDLTADSFNFLNAFIPQPMYKASEKVIISAAGSPQLSQFQQFPNPGLSCCSAPAWRACSASDDLSSKKINMH